MALKFFADNDHCGTKSISTFKELEDRFDSLDECCQTKFPQSVSACCEAGDGGCLLSGNFKFIPVSGALDSYMIQALNSKSLKLPEPLLISITELERADMFHQG
jgi:hypothetical protein